MKRTLIAVGIIAVALLIFLPLWSTWTEAGESGAEVYNAKCATCHGQDGAGATTMGKKFGLRDLGSAEVQAQTDAQLAAITADGKGKMPAYKGKLTDAQINAVVKHMRTFK